MTWKDLLVHVDDSEGCEARIEVAVALAKSHGAHLSGLYRSPEMDPRLYLDPAVGVETLSRISEQNRALEARAMQAFESALSQAEIAPEWRTAEGASVASLAAQAQYCDLVITGQSEGGDGSASTEALLLGSGRPQLIVPYVGVRATDFQRVLIAWTETPESTRAVHDALPLLTRASEVHVLCIVGHENEMEAAQSRAVTLCHHLSRHGVKASSHHQIDREIEVADALLSRSADLQIDAIVMGGYGHSKLREMVMGGATRGVLEHMTVPVLMSH